ncbi:MAG: mechanosensitive ion channel domain-containing protein [Gammaproteobacteria bacterium]
MQKTLLYGLLWSLALVAYPGQAEEEAALARLQRSVTDVEQELLRVERDIPDDRKRLQREELELRAAAITPALLEDARMEQASLRSRESGLKTRLKARRGALAQLAAEVDDLEIRIQRSADDDPGKRQWQVELEDLQQRRVVLEGLIDRLDDLYHRYETRTAIARQRLNLLQARFELPDLDAVRQSPGRAGAELQQQVDVLLTSATAARRAAAALGKDTPRDKAQARLLDLQALVAEERAEFQQLGIARLQVGRVLQSLSAFSAARSTPVRVLKTALRNIDKMQEELQQQQKLVEQKREQFLDQRQIVGQRGAIATGDDSTLPARLVLFDELTAAADEQLLAITALEQRMQSLREEYNTAVVTNAGAELALQRELPTDAESWQQLASNLAMLPLRVTLALKDSLVNFGAAFMHSDALTRGICVLLLLGLLLAGWQGRRLLSRQLVTSSEGAAVRQSTPGAPLAIVQRNLPSLLPPLFVLGAGMVLNLRQADLVLLLAPLLIWPVVRFALDFINNLLEEYTPELDPGRTRLLVLETRWVVILAAVLAAVLVTAHTVALSPLVIDAIERLSMVCLLLIALPLIHLRILLLEGLRGDVGSRLLRGFTLALPLLLVLCALIGIAGYVNLAWAIAVRLGWLMLVGLGLHFVRNILRALLKTAAGWFMRRDAETAPHWEQYILGPAYRVSVLLAVLGAVQLLFYLYNWNAQTPVVRAVPLMLDSTLFSIGETAIKLKTLGLALLALFVAIWGGGWSKQVSYRWLYTGVEDQGIRSSLSTFTQYLVVVLGLVVAMKIVGLDLTALTVFAGALGVGIGFGMQQIVVNFISGILLLVERPLATTDLVNVDKYEGEVTRIGIRSLTVKTFDNQEVIIPNSAVITKPFINWTRSDDIMRTVLMVGISYDDDPHQAAALILEQVKAHLAVLTDPGPKVLLWDYGESALLLRVQFHTRIRGPVGRGDVRSQLLFAIWDAFKDAGITIPYPQHDVHLHNPLQDKPSVV